MPDRDTIIEALQYLISGKCTDTQFDYLDEIEAAIAMLKEQEAVEPIPPTDESDLWKCGNCNHQLFRCTHQRYCEMCGKAVKWICLQN